MHFGYAQTNTNKAPVKVQSSVVQSQSAGAVVYRKNVESIVLIDAEDSGGRRQGSGVAIRNGFRPSANDTYVPASTWIVTNSHVVKESKYVGVSVDGFPAKGEVKYRDAQMDIAFVFLEGTVVKPVELTEKSALLTTGENVFAIGAPQGLTRSITDGIVSATRQIDGVRLIQTSAAISAGSSGGGLFNSSGELVGVTTFKVVGGESLNFAVEITQINKLFDAFAAADQMTIGLDPKHLPKFGDAFVKWVYSARGETGGTVLDEYSDAQAMWLKKELPLEKWIDKQFEIANRYYKLVAVANTPTNSHGANNGSAAEAKMVLICQLFGSRDGPRTESFEINFAEGTIDGQPARINSNFMQYSFKSKGGNEYTTVFDRNASTVTISTEGFPGLLHGKCSKSEGKAF
jgi:S1-C subfamily serine protease